MQLVPGADDLLENKRNYKTTQSISEDRVYAQQDLTKNSGNISA